MAAKSQTRNPAIPAGFLGLPHPAHLHPRTAQSPQPMCLPIGTATSGDLPRRLSRCGEKRGKRCGRRRRQASVGKRQQRHRRRIPVQLADSIGRWTSTGAELCRPFRAYDRYVGLTQACAAAPAWAEICRPVGACAFYVGLTRACAAFQLPAVSPTGRTHLRIQCRQCPHWRELGRPKTASEGTGGTAG